MFDGVINGVLIGMLVAAPVGPVNVICIQRTLRLGRISGFLAGLGAVLGDTIFALAASLQFVAISSFLKSHGFWLQIIGGVFLLAIGGYGLLYGREPKAEDGKVAAGATAGTWQSMVMTFVMTITNPMALLGVLALFAGAGGFVMSDDAGKAGLEMVLGVALGATLWWLMLTFVVGFFHGRIDPQWLHRLNQASNVAILGFASFILYKVATSGALI
jgi:Putative threonine efflux protein